MLARRLRNLWTRFTWPIVRRRQGLPSYAAMYDVGAEPGGTVRFATRGRGTVVRDDDDSAPEDSPVIEREVDFQAALTWLNSRVGRSVGLSVSAAPERMHRNWNVQAEGVLRPGPGERHLVDHLGGVVRDYQVGATRVQLVEDDLRKGVAFADDSDEWLHLHLGEAQVNFLVRR